MPIIRYTAILLFLGFLSYVVSIVVPYLRSRGTRTADPSAFQWHFLIPCRDEETVIEHTVVALRTDFPESCVWVIDDDSDDSTAEIVARLAADDAAVRLVQRRRPDARTGKGAALNAAYQELLRVVPEGTDRSRVVVCVVDADGTLDPHVLEHIAGDDCFGDVSVGAAQVAVHMRNRFDRAPRGHDVGRLRNAFARLLVRMQDIEFRTVIAAMQSLRTRTHSVGLGGNGQFTRLSVLDEIADTAGEPWHGALLEDYELGVHVMLAGHGVRYIHDTYVSQEAVPSVRRLVTQRTRWAQGNIQCIKYFPAMVRSPYLSNGGLLESAYYLALPFVQFIGLIVWGTLFIVGLVQTVQSWHDWTAADSGWAFVLFLFSLAPFFLWAPIYKSRCEPETTWFQVIIWGVGIWLYVYYTYFCIPRAFYRVVTRQNGWLKTRRNAEAILRGPIATDS